MFSGLIPALSAGREVIAVDLQAHGRTADIDRPMRFETLGDDIAVLLGHLDLPGLTCSAIRWGRAWP